MVPLVIVSLLAINLHLRYSATIGISFYALFGRMQFAYTTVQDITGILQAEMAVRACSALADTPERIPPTVLAIISVSSVLSGLASVIFAKLGLGKTMLLFPRPVTSGFLGAIGFVIFRNSLQVSSGVKFEYFYPVDWETFSGKNSLQQVALQVLTVLSIRLGRKAIARWNCGSTAKKVGPMLFQLLPLGMFYAWVLAAGIEFADLARAGWTYPRQSSGSALGLWTKYDRLHPDASVVLAAVPDMMTTILIAVLCTMTGVLAVTDAFPTGPPGDPDPHATIDFDHELTTAGVGSVLLGLSGGTLTFHTFNAIQLRMDGGTHRVAALTMAFMTGTAFLSSAPIGCYVPKWYLSGLFMNTAYSFLKGTLLSYRSLPVHKWNNMTFPSPQYFVSLCGLTAAVFFSPFTAIMAGLVLSVIFFVMQSSLGSPVSNVVRGDRVVSRSMRPHWELKTLTAQGDRVLLLYLQGQLFFGSARRLAAALASAAADEHVEFIVLSFAKVPSVDPSAAKSLKSATDKAKQAGCRVLCCRMNHSVYSALVAEGIVTLPDADLKEHLEGLKWPMMSMHKSPKTPLKKSLTRQLSTSGWYQSPDAFAHETDALDYCDESLISKYCYGEGHTASLAGYMVAYRASTVAPAQRLQDWAFEDMNGLPRQFLSQLQPFCEVLSGAASWQKLEAPPGTLCFIFRGAVSAVEALVKAEEVGIEAETKGFRYREGKRLHKRYYPGFVVGKHSFFLKLRGQELADSSDGRMQLVISSKLDCPAEVWLLTAEQWPTLPQTMREQLLFMLCVQMADAARHATMQER
eukprot:TRINITY_DN25400_c0_g1_i6.p1 TRINITY_DN25400_c0_g1~~TRINITY_DN25400_c0_g1_i6.p1  ORF type:complete len:801 (+),score=153.30 TRINITY_DN25400_c0_g1_i6:414-2816(+)